MNSKLCNKSNYGGKRASTLYLVIHYTSNRGDTAKNNADYFARENVGASAHFFVDENSVWSSVPEDCVAWHCGAKSYKHPTCRNNNSIGIEICMNDKQGKVRQASIDRAIELTKQLMDKYDIPVDRVLRHYDVTGKYCPGPMVDDVNLWNKFKEALEDDEMTYEKFKEYMNKYRAELTALPAESYAQQPIAELKAAGITDGTSPKGLLTREEGITMLYRALKK